MKTIQINEIEGFQIGSAQDIENATGCTVILCKEGATAGVDVRGGGPATRETDLLNPKNMVQKIHAVTLSGGSAFGLESSSGVMQYLSEHEIGFDMKNIYIPIVCEACLFDCGVGNSKAYPNKKMGYDACMEAEKNNPQQGNVGAGKPAGGPAHVGQSQPDQRHFSGRNGRRSHQDRFLPGDLRPHPVPGSKPAHTGQPRHGSRRRVRWRC